MRTITVLSILVIAFVAAGIGVESYLYHSSANLTDKLQATLQAVSEEDWAQAATLAKKLNAHWKATREIWNLFTEHEEIDDINGTLARLVGFVGEKEAPSALAEGEAALQLFQHVPQKETLNFVNVL